MYTYVYIYIYIIIYYIITRTFWDCFFLIVDLWAPESIIFDLNIRFSVKFPPRGLILRFRFWNLSPTNKKTITIAERLAKIYPYRLIRLSLWGATRLEETENTNHMVSYVFYPFKPHFCRAPPSSVAIHQVHENLKLDPEVATSAPCLDRLRACAPHIAEKDNTKIQY